MDRVVLLLTIFLTTRRSNMKARIRMFVCSAVVVAAGLIHAQEITDVRRLGDAVNTQFGFELGPTVSADSRILVFASDGRETSSNFRVVVD